MSGEVVHFEIPADRPERARKFYEAAFGWKMNPMPEFNYTMVQTTATGPEGRPNEPGAINGALAMRGENVAHPVLTILVDDITAAERTIVAKGGQVLMKRSPIGDGSMGFIGYFKDTEGNTIGLWERGGG